MRTNYRYNWSRFLSTASFATAPWQGQGRCGSVILAMSSGKSKSISRRLSCRIICK
ncbi:unnamed protein product [Periconia digitata]|uniref:Uncharacterized protein n=1 Tax=Periconia digitata TaxID=1303443 RepID=A0A9W4XWD6_9PLEO|nr:unnamed protein product [Periconia digitata]